MFYSSTQELPHLWSPMPTATSTGSPQKQFMPVASPCSEGISGRPVARNNVQRACLGCRKRKVKCCGFRPCQSCVNHGEPCSWTLSKDRRRAISREMYAKQENTIHSLKRHLNLLQERLRTGNLDDTLPADLDAGQVVSSDTDDVLSSKLSGLVVDDNQNLFYGETSPYSGLPRPSPMKGKSADHILQHSSSYTTSIVPPHTLRLDHCSPSPSPESRWDIYLARSNDDAPLITREEHDSILYGFFRYHASNALRVIPPLFLRDLAIATGSPHPQPQCTHYSAMLHNVIVAVSLSYANEERLRDPDLARQFIAKAKSTLDVEAQRPALSTVQALAVLSTYYCGTAEATLGFMYFGMCTKLSQCLGLHVRIPAGQISSDERIERDWVFWSVFVHDKVWSLYVGRDQGLPSSQLEIGLPTIDYRMDNEEYLVTAPNGQIVNQPSLVSSTFCEIANLMTFASRIMRAVYDQHLASRLVRKASEIASIYRELQKWKRNLSPALQINEPSTATLPSHVFILHVTYEWMVLLLLRPFYEPYAHFTTAQTLAVQDNNLLYQDARIMDLISLAQAECPTSACRVLALLDTYSKLYTLRFTPLCTVQMVHLAGMTFVRTLLGISSYTWHSTSRTPRRRLGAEEARNKVQESIKVLRVIASTWPAGNIPADLLEKQYETVEEILSSAAVHQTSRSPKSIARLLSRPKMQRPGASYQASDYGSYPSAYPTPQLPLSLPSVTIEQPVDQQLAIPYEVTYGATPPSYNLCSGVCTVYPDENRCAAPFNQGFFDMPFGSSSESTNDPKIIYQPPPYPPPQAQQPRSPWLDRPTSMNDWTHSGEPLSSAPCSFTPNLLLSLDACMTFDSESYDEMTDGDHD